MSDFKVPLTTITEILPHPKADRLEYAVVYAWHVIVQKDKFKVGDKVIYIPIDSILKPDLELKLFPSGSKIKLNRSRVRQIRIRGCVSQGMLIDPREFSEHNQFDGPEYGLETDYSELLGVSKYEPPQSKSSAPGTPGKPKKKKKENPHFRKYNGITNIKWVPHCFRGEDVVIQEKIHGSHIRFGRAPYVALTLFQKFKGLFGWNPKYEFVYGSNNVDLTNKKSYNGFYGEDIYGEVLRKVNAEEKLDDGEFVHGEIYGPGVQNNYAYGAKEHRLIIFDVRTCDEDGNQKWLNPEECELFAKERGFEFVPVLYIGPFSQEAVLAHTSGPSFLDPETKIREGCVVKSRLFYDKGGNKDCLKSINPDYLDDETNTDFH